MCFKGNVLSFCFLWLNRLLQTIVVPSHLIDRQTKGQTSCSCLSLPFALVAHIISLCLFCWHGLHKLSRNRVRAVVKPEHCCNHWWCRGWFVSNTNTFLHVLHGWLYIALKMIEMLWIFFLISHNALFKTKRKVLTAILGVNHRPHLTGGMLSPATVAAADGSSCFIFAFDKKKKNCLKY